MQEHVTWKNPYSGCIMMFEKSTRKFACDKEKNFKIEACNGPILLHPKGGFQPKIIELEHGMLLLNKNPFSFYINLL